MENISIYLLLLTLMSLCLMFHNIDNAISKSDSTKYFWDSGKVEQILAFLWGTNAIFWFIKFIESIKR